MKKILLTIASVLTLSVNLFSQNSVWLTIEEGQNVPVKRENKFISNNQQLNSILESYEITNVERVFPDSKNKILQNVYQIDCNCNEVELLQNQAMSNGRGESRFEGVKRTFEKPVAISSQVLLDRERCVLCARCTRFSEQIAGDPFITLNERGALQQVGIYEDEPFNSYYSGNTVQICQ